MEIFYEQNVGNPKIDKHKKRNTVLSVLRKVLLAIGIILAIIMILTLQITNALSVVLQLVFVILLVAPFVVAFFLLGRFLRNANSEYDYILSGGNLRIVQVICRNKRKLYATVPVLSIESVGRLSCDAYERYAAAKTVKKQFALCNYEEEDRLTYIRYRNDGVDYLLHIEPNDEMVSSLRRSLPRIGIMDKSMNTPTIVPKK